MSPMSKMVPRTAWTKLGFAPPRLIRPWGAALTSLSTQSQRRIASRRQATASAARPAAIPSPSLPPVVLRDYQEDAIQSVLSHLSAGQRRLGISLATGSGKTVIFSRLIERITPPSKIATRTLILAHRQELVEAAARHCRSAYPDKSVEIEMANIRASGLADITVASVATLISGTRLHKFRPHLYKLILVDEAHHIVAKSYLDILDHFRLLNKDAVSAGATPALVGVSATFSRSDGLGLGKAIDHIVYHKDYVDMIRDSWLSNVIFTTVDYKVDLSSIRLNNHNGDFQTSELSKAVNTQQAIEVAIRAWQARASGSRKTTLVFCVDVAHVVDMTNTFRAFGYDARSVTGETPRAQRAELLEGFKRGEFPVLLNCGVFTEGTDIPNIDCILLARPTRSRNLLVQMIGRGMRLSEGKKDCHVIDLVASLETGIVTVPTLFGLDPDELVEEASTQDLEATKKRQDEAAIRRLKAQELAPIATKGSLQPTNPTGQGVKVQYTDYESVFDLMEDTSAERHIRGISRFAWVNVDMDKYVLANLDNSFLTLQLINSSAADDLARSSFKQERDRGAALWRVTFARAFPKAYVDGRKGLKGAPYARTKTLAEVETFTNAVHAADTFAKEHFAFVGIDARAKWRQSEATEGQVRFLNRFRGPGEEYAVPGDELDDEDREGVRIRKRKLKKGDAMDMITKIKHGARGRFEKGQIVRRKEERLVERRERVNRRERVAVGPLAV